MSWAHRPPAAERIAARRARRGRRLAAALTAGLIVLVGVVFGAARLALVLVPDPVPPRSNLCEATASGITYSLRPVQAGNAATIAAVGLTRNLPEQADVIAIATAMQESSLVNIDHGDLDSLGLFQQRPSQGWGTAEQVMDPVYAANAFFDVLTQIDGYTQMPVTDAAQKVQRSAFPDAYGRHEAMARAFAGGFAGHPAVVSCELDETTAAGNAAGVMSRLGRDFGAVATTLADTDSGGTVITADPAGLAASIGQPVDVVAWAIAQWAVANAAEFNIATVTTGEHTWQRSGGWHEDVEPSASASGEPVSAMTVSIRLP